MWSDNESKDDLLGFDYLASAVVSIVKDENLLPATIGVFGDWGGGKSTLIEIVKSHLTSEPEQKAGVVVLSFNGWLFEGYEGAKTALMGTILEELQEHETFVNKASDKAKSLLKSLARRVDWMKATLGLAKVAGGLASAAHGGSLLLLSGGADLAGIAKDAKEFIKDEAKDVDKEESETRRQIQNFRRDFEGKRGTLAVLTLS
jgi:predicted KAP-like P-loop ATPase